MTTRAYFRQWRAAQWATEPAVIVDIHRFLASDPVTLHRAYVGRFAIGGVALTTGDVSQWLRFVANHGYALIEAAP